MGLKYKSGRARQSKVDTNLVREETESGKESETVPAEIERVPAKESETVPAKGSETVPYERERQYQLRRVR